MRPLYRAGFFVFLFIFYWFFSFDKVPFGDALGFVNMAEMNEFTDNTTVFGKFLYTNFLIGFKTVFGLESIPATRFFNLIFSVLTLIVLFFGLRLKFKNERMAYLGTLIFALSFTFWKQTEIIEVYTFNSFWIAVYIYFCILFLETKKQRFIFLASLILGLSLWAHVQNMMLIPAWLLLCASAYKDHKINILPSVLIFFTLAFALYFLAYINGYDTVSVYGSRNSKWVEGSLQKPLSGFAKDILVAAGYLIYNFWIFTVPGIIVIFRKIKAFQDSQNLFYLFSFLVPFGFATIYNVSDNYVFFLNAYLFFVFFIIEGLINLQILKPRFYQAISLSILLVPFFYILSFFAVSHTTPGHKFDKEKSYKGGLSYYLFPWMHSNIGVLEYYLDEKTPSDNQDFMYNNCQEFLKLRKDKNTLEEIKKM